ncbi:MAG: DUF294 nucleotidyltransferase-like domain-containing protein, partial [Pseudomonadota bacterium]
MDVELIEIRDFLAEHPPFDLLPDEVLDTLPKRLTVRYLRRGSDFPPKTEKSSAIIIRMGAVELRDSNGELLEKLGEGELFAEACPDNDAALPARGRCVEDALLYLLPCEALQALREHHPDFNHHFEQSLRLRLQHAIQQLQQGQGNISNLMNIKAGDLIRRPPVTGEPEQSIRQAAQIMSEARVSSLLIIRNEQLLGIVTDRDLRRRCIAEGVETDRPVSTIMVGDIITFEMDGPAFEALLLMTRRQIHHLPLLSRNGELRGVITANDLLHQHSLNTVSIAGRIRRCLSTEELVETSRELPELQLQLIRSGMTALQMSHALSPVIDAISRRLISLAEERLGPPPVPYVWLACGSQARREQTAFSDQDNALLIADEMQPEDDTWFTELARFVSDGLARCGFEYCPGEVMATNPKWRQPLRVWRRYFEKWVNSPEPMALMHTSIFFDMRPLHGDETLYRALRDEVLPQCRNNTIFLAAMAANALKHRPPLGFFRQFVLVHDKEHDDTLDMKHRGVIPVVDLA